MENCLKYDKNIQISTQCTIIYQKSFGRHNQNSSTKVNDVKFKIPNKIESCFKINEVRLLHSRGFPEYKNIGDILAVMVLVNN